MSERVAMDKGRKLRVLMVSEEGRFGGPSNVIVHLASHIKKLDVDVLVAIPRLDSETFHERLREKGVRTKLLFLHRLTLEKKILFRYVLFFVYEVFSLARLIREENVDIVHCHTIFQIKGMIAARLCGVKAIWHLHESKMLAPVARVFNFLSCRLASGFITAGLRVKNNMLDGKGFPEEKIRIIPSPVDTSVFDPHVVAENETLSPYDGLKIVNVSNVNRIKGIECFIEAASILNKKYDGLSFIVVGGVFQRHLKYKASLKGLANRLGVENLHFHGQSNYVPQVLKSADVYVCSSVSEASPQSVSEAWSMAKPMVSTDVGDVARFIKDGENGYVVPVGDAAAMADRIGRLIEDKHLRETMGARAREIALEHFDIAKISGRLVRFYREVLGD